MTLNRICPLLIVSLAFLSAPARAQDTQEEEMREISTGVGLVCDTKEQIESLVKADENSDQFTATLHEINAGKAACGVANIAYIRGDKIGQVRTRKGLHEIFEITVMAADVGGVMRPIPPEKQVIAFLVKGVEI